MSGFEEYGGFNEVYLQKFLFNMQKYISFLNKIY